MRVTLVSSSSGSTGGGEIYLSYLATGLLNLGHDVQAICSSATAMDDWARSLSDHCEVIRSGFMPTYDRRTRSFGASLDFPQQARMRRLLQTCGTDLVHINQQVAEDGLDLLLAARGAGVPFLSTIHITHSAEELGARFGWLRDFVAGKVIQSLRAPHITVAESSRKRLLDRFKKLDPANVHVVKNGVPLPEPNPALREITRKRWGVGPNEIVLGCVGRLNPQKSPEFALEIVSALKREHLPLRFVWIGDGAGRKRFEQRASELSIGSLVCLEGWRDDVSDCLAGLDLFLMPSRFEGMPLALLEAMGAGLCCCVSAVDGMEEIIEHGRTGFLCAPGNLAQWRGQVEQLINNPSLRQAVGQRARAYAQQSHSLEAMARETAEIYEDVRSEAVTTDSQKPVPLTSVPPPSERGL